MKRLVVSCGVTRLSAQRNFNFRMLDTKAGGQE